MVQRCCIHDTISVTITKSWYKYVAGLQDKTSCSKLGKGMEKGMG